jgi:alcohol dehydrogenase class IV
MVTSLESPRGIYFGPGRFVEVEALAASFGDRVLVVTGQSSLLASGREQIVRSALADLDTVWLPCPPGEPTVEGIEALRVAISGHIPEVIVAIGGGSVLDTAKALSVLLPSRAQLLDFLEGIGKGLQVSEPGIPWIAVPTTAGTGAEVTKNSVVKSSEHAVKKSMRSVHLLATFAVVDPELTLGTPKIITGIAGMDALTQLVESYVSRKKTGLTRALIREAFPGTLTALRELAGGSDALEAREAVAFGSLVSGIALANSGLGAAHGFASGLGGATAIPHGLICGMLLPGVLAFNRPAIEPDISELVSGTARGQGVDWLLETAIELIDSFGLRAEWQRYEVPVEKIAGIAERSSGSSMAGNPVEMSQGEREALLRDVL